MLVVKVLEALWLVVWRSSSRAEDETCVEDVRNVLAFD